MVLVLGVGRRGRCRDLRSSGGRRALGLVSPRLRRRVVRDGMDKPEAVLVVPCNVEGAAGDIQ